MNIEENLKNEKLCFNKRDKLKAHRQTSVIEKAVLSLLLTYFM